MKNPKAQPELVHNKSERKALHLPMPGPGIVVSVPLGLLPEYLALYHLKPMADRSPFRVGDANLKLLVQRDEEMKES